MKISTLDELSRQQSHLCYWRVRQTNTLEDFCILYPMFKDGGTWYTALNLDQNCIKVNLAGSLPVYVLLSSQEESKRLSGYTETESRKTFLQTYKNA